MPDRGAALAAAYSTEVVEPLVERAFPGLPFSTARLGSGSDVLGLDDAMSRDHDWGLRLTVVVEEQAVGPVDALLERTLPDTVAGLPTRFATTWDPVVRQRAEVVSAGGLAESRCGVDATRPLQPADWLRLTGQAVLELTAGPVFRDDVGRLAAVRARLAAPPDDVRAWAVGSAWGRIGQELPALGRAGDRGDERGSRLIGGRIAQTVLRLAFLLERRWAPYAKWLGTAFTALPAARTVGPPLDAALAADTWRAREDALAVALDALAAVQRDRGLPSLVPATEPFYDRPYRGLRGIPELVLTAVADPVLRSAPPVGLPEFWTDDVRILTDHPLRRRMVDALLSR